MRWMKCWTRNARPASPFGFFLGIAWRLGEPGRAGICLLLLLSLLASGGVLACLSQETTLHSQSNVVVIPALVKGAKGEIVYGLEARDFLVEDDGVEQAVHLDEAAEGQAVSM